MAWLNGWENDWEPFANNRIMRAWPTPYSQRRFAAFWYPFFQPSVSPLPERFLTRNRITEDDAIVLWGDIQLFEVGLWHCAGDTGISPEGRRLSLDVEWFRDGALVVGGPFIRWRWTYHRNGFSDDIVSDVQFTKGFAPTLRVVFDFDMPRQSSYAFGPIFSQWNWTPQLDTDITNPLRTQVFNWIVAEQRTPVPNNP